MEELAMLRQLIGEFQELCELHGSSLPYNLHRHPHHRLHPTLHEQLIQQHQRLQLQRWCFLDFNNSTIDDGYYNLVMRGAKSSNFKMVENCKPPPTKKSRRERSSNEIMEEHIWKEFPEDLFEAVIARLPIAIFFQFRSVCRKWNSLLSSNSFSQHCAEVPQSHPWFYTITHENEYAHSGAVYDPSLKKWHHPPIPSLMANIIIFPVASVGGLVCFLDIGNMNFYVCNPLTQSFKKLPPRSVRVWSRVAVGMTLNGSSTDKGYKILWVGYNGEYEVYDSVKNTWTHPGSMPTNIKLPLSLNFQSQSISVDGTLYFMCAEPEGIVSYDMATGVWKQFTIPSPPHLADHAIAQCGGRIMLVGLLSKNAATCVCIWELQKMTLLWKEVDRMPNIWCLDFYGKHVRMACLGNKGLLMLSLRLGQKNRLVTYNILNREWKRVPGCMFPRGRKRWIASGTAFHPCPTAVA
ncbi:F-box only protein 6-like [Macadamia integrifolia]|uniref:F-box only protein 6-like n=1 Tax=Macadamia integrifolia TaxID=60698 RepID=UPI001C4E88AA|nr:F-box only protein 6-like [Macadamia integrifolia]